MKREGFGPLFFVFTITIVHYRSCGIPARVYSFGIPAPVPSNSIHQSLNFLHHETSVPN